MKIVHLVSNFRWTERVEPAADLAIAQQKLGHDVRFLCGHNKGEPPENCVQGRAARKQLEFDDRLIFHKHFRWAATMKDLPRLKKFLASFQPDVIHAHLSNAHLLAALALRRAASPCPLLVRTIYGPEGPGWPLRFRWISCPATDGLILASEKTNLPVCGRLANAPERIATILPGIDVDEFADRHDLGKLENITVPPGALVVGMIASINKRRRLDLALEAVAKLAPRHPNLHLLFIGRGTPELYIHEPARQLGISDRILYAGYCRNDDLVRAFHTMDALIYPIHGTDPSCRTVREALATGTPVIAANRGIMDELIDDGQTGFLAPFSADGLAEALEKLIALGPGGRANMSAAAAADARKRFCRVAQARRAVEFYERLQALPAKA